MWVFLSLGSALIYTAQWAVVRASHQKIPSSMMTAAYGTLGPALAAGAFVHPMPLDEPVVLFYLFYIFVINPPFSWFSTYAIQRMPVSLSQPLSSLAVISSTLGGMLLFRTEFSPLGLLGIAFGFAGLWMLYHARWSEWTKPYPWILSLCILNFGFLSTVIGQVLEVYPHPVILTGIGMSGTLSLSLVGSVLQRRQIRLTKQTFAMLAFISVSHITSDALQLTAMGIAPAAYVISVKRASIILSALLGYSLFRERQTPFWRLMTASFIVLLAIIFLAVG